MAIDELLDEREQGERVRDWLRRNAAGLIGGVLLGLAAIFGWQWWQKYQITQQITVADRYQSALAALETGNAAKAKPLVDALQGSAYHGLAALLLAKVQTESAQTDAAIATLRGILGDSPGFDAVVEQRLARLLIDTGKPQDALTLLADKQGPGLDEVRGDAQFAAGKHEAARASYRKALATAEVGSQARSLLELKFSQVGGNSAADSATDSAALEAKS